MHSSDTPSTLEAPRVAARELGLAFGLASVGALGALPGSRSGSDPVALLVWLSVWSLPAGFAYGASRLRLWPLAPVVPALWMALLAVVDGASVRDIATPAWAALAWSGLFACGLGLGRLSPRASWTGTAGLVCAMGCLAFLPLAGGFVDVSWSPRVSALFLDLSPATLCAECGGLDWMRHPAVYDAARTFDIDPSLRSSWQGFLAGPTVFLVGCCAAVAGDRIARARR